MSIDVETGIGDAGVATLVEEVVELEFQVTATNLVLGLDVAEPSVAVGGGEVRIVVLDGGGEGHSLGDIDVHGEALGGGAKNRPTPCPPC